MRWLTYQIPQRQVVLEPPSMGVVIRRELLNRRGAGATVKVSPVIINVLKTQRRCGQQMG